ncbi:hypothetical protein [Streptomyces pinistramenti]|uniref:hypothetical protein n=1 Tax=Streptomyces pinistramenti TaxID=2884812 RepID=UPI001D0608C6|nr:hypothetical protein [Streptomyces pinistramenti]MCB5909575.1 hypothetical protein [Streptomyces pinistramenti]
MTPGAGPRHARPRRLKRLAGGATVAAAVVGEVLGAGALTADAAGRSLILIDNSHADSWLEIDRAFNLQLGGGVTGSDLDGGGTHLTYTLLSPLTREDRGNHGEPASAGEKEEE